MGQRCVAHLLHAGDQGGKTGDDDAAGCSAEDLIEGRIDHPLGRRPTALIGVGRVGQQRQDTPRSASSASLA